MSQIVPNGRETPLRGSVENSVPRRSSVAAVTAAAHWTCFIDNECTPHQFLAVASLTRLHCGRVIVEFHKAESACLPGETVSHNRDGIDGHTVFSKKRLHVLFIGGVWKVPIKSLFTPLLLEALFEAGRH